MSAFNQSKFDELKKLLTDEFKKIENYEKRRQLPKEPTEREVRINQYKTELVGHYNIFTTYVKNFYPTFALNSQFEINELTENLKLKVKKCLAILNLEAVLPENLEKIDINTVKRIDSIENNTTHASRESTSSELTDKLSESSIKETSEPEDLFSSSSDLFNEDQAHSSTIIPITQIECESQQLNSNSTIGTAPHENTTNNQIMALTPGDILNGIPDFDSKNQTEVNKFIATVDMMNTLAPAQANIILTVARAKLITANKLGNISDKTWAQIKVEINEKYKLLIPFEVAQEKIISIKQNPKESLDTYANRVKSLLDALNGATTNDNNDVQASNRVMNENLAIRKFKQNILDREIRVMAVATEHTSLVEAISHALAKSEQLGASNVAHQSQLEKKETNNNSNKYTSTTQNKQSNFHGKNEKSGQKTDLFCKYCKRNNHNIDSCRTLARKNGNKPNAEKLENQPQNSSTAVAAKQAENQQLNEQIAGSASELDIQSLTLQPYHLNC